jgi:hypothetical protein
VVSTSFIASSVSGRHEMTEVHVADGPLLELRPAKSADLPDIARIFSATVLLGAPLVIRDAAMTRYRALCLDWYGTAGDDGGGIVALEDGVVRGYLLHCLDQGAFMRWQRGAAVRWVSGEILAALFGRRTFSEVRFFGLRLLDGLRSLRTASEPPYLAHAHFNLDPEVRGRSTGHRLAAAMDELVAARGLDGWFGEMNLPEGFPTDALERAGAVLGHRQRNATLSALTGMTVWRTTVTRPLAERTDAFLVRAAATEAKHGVTDGVTQEHPEPARIPEVVG